MKFNKKYVLITLLLILFILGIFFIYQIFQKSKEENIDSPSGNYEMSEDNFNKILTGYVVLEEKELPLKEDFEKYYWDLPLGSFLVKGTYVYFRIIDCTDKEFVEELEKAINQGNTINEKDGDDILFNLGCLESGRIEVDRIDIDNYINEETRKAILESNEKNPVKIILKLDTSEGHGCRCCSFAEKVRLYEE
jgi:hypothetical protein